MVAFVGLDDMKVVRVAPGALSVDLKLRAELGKAKKQTPFIKRGKRGNRHRATGPWTRLFAHSRMRLAGGVQFHAISLSLIIGAAESG